MKTFKAIIIDDEPDAIDYLKDILKDFPEIEVCASLTGPFKVVDTVMDHLPDLIFLDIQMPRKDGFEVMKEIRQVNSNIYIIFTTAYDKYAIGAVKHAAFDYLLKPIDPEELKSTLARLKQDAFRHDQQSRVESLLQYIDHNKKLRFNTRTGFIILNSSDIIYIESDRNYSTIFLKEGHQEVITMNLGAMEELLPSTFRRISRFHIINTGLLAKVDRKKHVCILSHAGHEYSLPVNRENIKGLEGMW